MVCDYLFQQHEISPFQCEFSSWNNLKSGLQIIAESILSTCEVLGLSINTQFYKIQSDFPICCSVHC